MSSSERAATDEPEGPALPTRTVHDGGENLASGDFTVPHRSPGARVGDYIVLEQLGAGGMGVVYAAYDPQLDRKIALKVLRPDFDSATFAVARARMIGEGRALARLSHPNVVGVHDVGSIDDEVYIAMELVDGQTLGRWRKAASRSVAEIVGVFLAIADGLAAVHDTGLVHRDVKPDNVLVDRHGRARVTDFGLARPDRDAPQPSPAVPQRPVVDAVASATERLDLTRTGSRLGTPAYMACEQLRGETATARSDQFSFCVSFWECLYGERPFVSETFASLVLAVGNGAIREPPQAPEGRVVPPWLRRILERGLQPDPQQRWPSMRELASAVLRGDPNRRRRRIVAWSAVGAAVVAASLGVSLTRVAAHDRALEDCAHTAAAIDAVWSADARERVLSAFAAANATDGTRTGTEIALALDRHTARWTELRAEACVATVEQTRAPELAPLAVDCLDRSRGVLEAMVHVFEAADAVVVARARRSVEGLGELERCQDERHLRSLPPLPDDPRVRDEVRALHEELTRTQVHEHTGRWDEGLALSEAALERAIVTEHLPIIANARYRVAVFREKRGEYAAAVDAWAASFHDAALAGADQLAAEAASALAFCEGHQLARHDTGIRWAEIAGVYLERLGATDTLTEATRLDVLAVLLESRGDLEASIETHERAIALRRTLVAANHHSIGYGLANLAGVLESSGERERARDHLIEAKAIFEAAFGPDNPTTAHVLHNLANLQIDLGAYDEAEALLVRVQSIWTASLRPDHPDLGDIENAFGDLHRARGRFEDAAAAHGRALAIHQRGLEPDHPTIAQSAIERAQVLVVLGRLDDAQRDYELARAVLKNAGDDERDRKGRVHHGLATIALLRGQADVAREAFTRSLADFESHGDGHPRWIARARIGLAAVAIAEGTPRAAMDELAKLATDEALSTSVRAEAWAWHARASAAAGDEAARTRAKEQAHALADDPAFRTELDALIAAQ